MHIDKYRTWGILLGKKHFKAFLESYIKPTINVKGNKCLVQCHVINSIIGNIYMEQLKENNLLLETRNHLYRRENIGF